VPRRAGPETTGVHGGPGHRRRTTPGSNANPWCGSKAVIGPVAKLIAGRNSRPFGPPTKCTRDQVIGAAASTGRRRSGATRDRGAPPAINACGPVQQVPATRQRGSSRGREARISSGDGNRGDDPRRQLFAFGAAAPNPQNSTPPSRSTSRSQRNRNTDRSVPNGAIESTIKPSTRGAGLLGRRGGEGRRACRR